MKLFFQSKYRLLVVITNDIFLGWVNEWLSKRQKKFHRGADVLKREREKNEEKIRKRVNRETYKRSILWIFLLTHYDPMYKKKYIRQTLITR